jgi:hypothetical protein
MKITIIRVSLLLGVLFYVSCRKCKECTILDYNGTYSGSMELCGDELKEAEKDSLFICD